MIANPLNNDYLIYILCTD